MGGLTGPGAWELPRLLPRLGVPGRPDGLRHLYPCPMCGQEDAVVDRGDDDVTLTCDCDEVAVAREVERWIMRTPTAAELHVKGSKTPSPSGSRRRSTLRRGLR